MKIEQTTGIVMVRSRFSEKSTLSKIYVDGEFVCYGLENPYLGNERNRSCIPKGKYEWVKRNDSPKYKYEHIHVLDVPNRSWILFHIGNYPKDTLGCILPGTTWDDDVVWQSTLAFNKLMNTLENCEGGTVTIVDKYEVD